jgi:S-formylglutathione hydrolase FrmB
MNESRIAQHEGCDRSQLEYTWPVLRTASLFALVFCIACRTPEGSASRASSSASASVPASASASVPASVSAPVSVPASVPASRVVTRSFRSEALGGVDKTYLAYLPRGYDASSKRYPVLYLLHGYAGDETNWTRPGDLPKAADAIDLQAIVVMPDGDDSFYANWVSPFPYDECLVSRPSAFGRTERAETYCVRGHRYEDYIAKDLVAHVEATYRALPDRRARAITGLSMGGFGALMLAMRHPDTFAVAASHSGVVSPLYEGPHPYREGEVALRSSPALGKEFPPELRDRAASVFGPDIANWRAHDPSALAASLKPGALAIYIDCGTEDGFKLADQARYLHEVLTKAGASHTFELVPGGHSFALWKERIKNSLAFTAGEFKKAGY